MKHQAATAPLTAVILAGFLLAGSGCAAPRSAPAPGTATPTAAASPATADPSATSSPAPEAAALKSFTFPDGHLSFDYPADWSIETGQAPYLTEADKAGAVEAVIYDASGKPAVRVVSGTYGDGAAGPVSRSVYDMEPVMGIKATDGETPLLGYAVDTYPGGGINTHFDVRVVNEFVDHAGTSGTNQVKLDNGVMVAQALLHDGATQAFATESEASDWMATEEYKQIRALLLSLKYS